MDKTFDWFVKADLSKLENMLLQAKPAVGWATDRVFVRTSWKIIFAVIVFLICLSFVLFVIWHKQEKISAVEEKNDKADVN